MNCHFVTRSLTTDWEPKGGTLWYFDFKTGKVARQFSKKLFADEDTNSKDVEDLISKYIERPIGTFKHSILPTAKDGESVKIDDWGVFRGIYLYFLFQSQRYSKAQLPEEENKLDELLKKDEQFLDTFVSAYAQEYQLVSMKLPPGKFLFFPEIGYFQFPTQDAGCVTGFTLGFAFPLSPSLAVALVSKSAGREQLISVLPTLEAYSVGLNDNMSRIVIAPVVLESVSQERIVEVIRGYREKAIETVGAIHKIRELTVNAYEKIGLRVDERRKIELARTDESHSGNTSSKS